MARETFGDLLGISGIIDQPGQSGSFVIGPDSVRQHKTTLRVDVFPYKAFGSAKPRKRVVIGTDGEGFVQAQIKNTTAIGLDNIEGANGKGNLVINMGQGRKATVPVVMSQITVSKDAGVGPANISFAYYVDGDYAESAV
ncbi:MAG: hypothetical protein GVY12_00640 [Bacteroidetes bacterium]|nr:hypothetical protein [Bacteroidota bacterium]